MEQREFLHVIGIGGPEDWEAGRGSFYYIEDKNNETALPVFTTGEAAEAHVEANFHIPKAHMEMLESAPTSHLDPLTEGRCVIMPLDREGVAQVAALLDADYLLRDPRPGNDQDILRFSE
jgi:hypothetical protein